jgi:hypothetical protein
MLAVLSARRETLDMAGAWGILRSVVRPSEHAPELLTYQSVVFEPNKRRLHVAFSANGRPAAECRTATLDVSELLGGNEFHHDADRN